MNKSDIILGMPFIENIVQLSYSCPSEWMLRSVEGKLFHVLFNRGELRVRRDNRWSGKEVITIDFPSARLCQYMSTEDMIAHTGFRLNHEDYSTKEEKVQCG